MPVGLFCASVLHVQHSYSPLSPTDDSNVHFAAKMLPRLGKEFLVRMQFNWRPLFQGRALLLTNTLSGGVLLALGDIVQQSRENLKKPGRVRDWRRTGEKSAAFSTSLLKCLRNALRSELTPYSLSTQRLHVYGGLLLWSGAALLVPLAGWSVCGQSSENGGQKGSGGPGDRLTVFGHVVFCR